MTSGSKVSVFTKQEYVSLIPPVSTADYDRLKVSIREQGGLLMPIIINQDNVVLDGHHRLRACKELGIPITYATKDFTGKPLDELRYVVAVNLHRRHLDEFQRAEIALKYDKMYRKIAKDAWLATRYDSVTGAEAANKRWNPESLEDIRDGGDDDEMPQASAERDGTTTSKPGPERADSTTTRSADMLGKEFGVSGSTIERVRTILDQGTPEQIQALREKGETGEGPGVRTVYEQVQQDKLKNKLLSGTKAMEEAGMLPPTITPPKPDRSDSLKLFNKDFRTITREEIPDGSADLVLVLDFPEPRIREDEGGRMYTQLATSACDWLKDGGLLAMHVEPHFLQRAICEKPPLLQFHDIVSVFETGLYEQRPSRTMFQQECRHLVVYVKGVRETRPITPQTNSTNRIGGGAETWSSEKVFAAEIVKRLSATGSTIVDPFLGQSKGIVGLAVIESGRTYVGIEPETTQFLSAMNKLYG